MRWIFTLSLLVIACGAGNEPTGNAAAADAEAASLLQSVVPILEDQSCPIPSPSPSDQPQAVLAVSPFLTLAKAAQICRDTCQDGAKVMRKQRLGVWAWLGFLSCPISTAVETLCLELCTEAEQKFQHGQFSPAPFENELELITSRMWREAQALSDDRLHDELRLVAALVSATMNGAREKLREFF